MGDKEKLINKILSSEKTNARNSMGCDESWYNPYYAIKHTFDEEKIRSMTPDELYDLIQLAETIAEYLY